MWGTHTKTKTKALMRLKSSRTSSHLRNLSRDQVKVTTSDLIATATKRTTQKILGGALRTVDDLFMGYLNKDRADLLAEIVEFHCYSVNPRELVVSLCFIKSLNDPVLNNAPLVKMYILFTQYTNDKVSNQLNGPCISQFLDQNALSALCKNIEVVQDLEKMVEDLRNKALPRLEKGMQVPMARLQVAHFMDMVIRCLLSK